MHLIPSGNSNDQKKYILVLPFSSTYSLRKFFHPLLCSHTPSKLCGHPLLYYTVPQSTPPLGKFPHMSTNQGISLPQNHHTGHKILMEINGHYWAAVSIMGLLLKFFSNIVLSVSIPFTEAANSWCQFQSSNHEFPCFLYQEHNFH